MRVSIPCFLRCKRLSTPIPCTLLFPGDRTDATLRFAAMKRLPGSSLPICWQPAVQSDVCFQSFPGPQVRSGGSCTQAAPRRLSHRTSDRARLSRLWFYRFADSRPALADGSFQNLHVNICEMWRARSPLSLTGCRNPPSRLYLRLKRITKPYTLS